MTQYFGPPFALSEAIRLAEHGYTLTPVTITRRSDGKKAPRFHRASWRHEADVSADPDQVRAWSVDYVGCSFALVCGPSGVEGVDLDVKPAEGIDAVLWWSEQGLPAGGLIVETPSGGQHHIWRRRSEGRVLPTSAGRAVRGVDTRSSDGLFFAAGSYVVGEPGHYRVTGTLPKATELPVTPDQVLDLFPEKARTDRRADGQITVHGADWMKAKLTEQLNKVCDHQRDKGGFRHRLMGAAMVAGRLVENGLIDQDTAVADLRAAAALVWGRADADDEAWIEDGLRDGPARERWREPAALTALAQFTPPETDPQNPQNPAADGGVGPGFRS